MHMYTNNMQEYAQLVQHVNKLMHTTDGYIGHGINCTINLIRMESYSNCDVFTCDRLMAFFNKVCLKSKVGIVKIAVEGAELRVIRGDGRLFSIGEPVYTP